MPAPCPLSVAEILAMDEEYRAAAAAGKLKKIAPKAQNPTGEAWLPVMGWKLDNARVTALYSNTPLAHRLGKTHDWVVFYYRERGQPRGAQCTVVTEWHPGPLQGKRVVRGREAETLAYYESQGQAA